MDGVGTGISTRSAHALTSTFPMPPRLSTFRRLLPITSEGPIGLRYCPACTFWWISRLQITRPNDRHTTRPRSLSRPRTTSTLASATAINATKQIPTFNRELHDALSELKSKAGNYVDLNRLQLALRGLETKDAVIRVAGMNSGKRHCCP